MIVKNEDSYSMICPMTLSAEESGRCGGDRCMAWRDLGDGRGFCGMCPTTPLVARRIEERVSHD